MSLVDATDEEAFAREWHADRDPDQPPPAPAPRPARPRSRPASPATAPPAPGRRCVVCGRPTPGTYTCSATCLATL